MRQVPTFGEIDRAPDYVSRPSAYAILTNDAGCIAVVEGHGHYLPGGGLEPGEDAEMAVARECFEECGVRVQQLSQIGSAVQFLHAPGEGWFRIEADFYFGHVRGASSDTLGHSFSWVEPHMAADLMTRAFERWAIETWLAER